MKTVTINATGSKLSKILGLDYGLIVKIDVSNMAKSVDWYTVKLGLTVNPNYNSPYWTQLIIPGIVNSEIGLNLDAANAGTGGENTTFIVPDIKKAIAHLEAEGIKVSPVQSPSPGVYLAFFSDPDNNALGLRQNP